MNQARSSYEFHLGLESPGSFFRREWKAIALIGGGAALVMCAAILLIDPAFFYPRLQTDPLNYWLKARSLVEHGSTAARWAVNQPPFSYAAAPGILRAPALVVFGEFDQQLRAIQFANVIMLSALASVAAYILSWTQPPRRHWMVIAFAFAFTLFTPVWMANVFLPLVDAPYALFTLLAVLVSIDLVTSETLPTQRPLALIAFAGLFIISFLLRFTAPVILVFALVLARGKWPAGSVSPRTRKAIWASTAIALLMLVVFNADAIFGRYFREPIGFLIKGDKVGMILNLLGAAIPSQIIPNFQEGFPQPPVVDTYRTTFFHSPASIAWLVFGLAICAVVVCGMWQARSRLLPELAYFLAALPVLTLMMPSTTRYLLTYQPFIWLFFISGAAWLFGRYAAKLPAAIRTRRFVLITTLLAAVLVVGLRSWRLVGSASETRLRVSAASAPGYITDVSTTFRSLREFLETLPREQTLLVAESGTVGRWKAIADRDYYSPDSGLTAVTRHKDVYLVVECGTMEGCQSWDLFRKLLERRIARFGEFQYDSVYAITRPRARAEVFRVRAVE